MLLAPSSLTAQLELSNDTASVMDAVVDADAADVAKQSDSESDEILSASSDDTSDRPDEKTSAEELKATDEPKQTRQKRDWRPKSTLHLRRHDPSQLKGFEKLAKQVLMSDSYHELKPLDLDRGPVPVHSTWREHAWILPRAMAGVMIQQLSYYFFPQFKWPIWLAYPFYLFLAERFSIACVKRFDRFALEYGTLNEKNIGRDRIPDESVDSLAKGFIAYLVFRTLGDFVLFWNRNEQPLANFSVYTPVKMFLWLMTLDYVFYCYHRSCHEVDWLWQVHQKHHQSRTPSPAHSILADNIQEVIEIALCPLVASLVVPLTFHELIVTFCYTTYVEVLGHSGIRADWSLPIMGPPLRLFGLDLMIEDHDLHHRYGKSGRNYSKQTRIYDVLFGTTTPREEFANLKGHRPL